MVMHVHMQWNRTKDVRSVDANSGLEEKKHWLEGGKENRMQSVLLQYISMIHSVKERKANRGSHTSCDHLYQRLLWGHDFVTA